MASHTFLISSAYVAWTFVVSEGFSRRQVHASTPVEFHAAYVWVGNPDVYVGRIKTVLPGMYNKTELAFHHYSRHVQSFSNWLSTLCARPEESIV